MGALGILMLRRGTMNNPVAGSDYILSESRGDPEVFRILMEKGVSSDGVGITKDDAARVTDIKDWFYGNTVITHFDEFQFFTGVTVLGNNDSAKKSAFGNCTNLASISLPPSLSRIRMSNPIYGGFQGFYNCTSLAKLDGLESVPKIGSSTLYGCSNLYYDVLDLSNVVEWGYDVLYAVKVKKLILNNVSTLPDANAISRQNYGSKGVLESLELSDEVVVIPQNSFYEYTQLREIFLIWENLTTIGASAFRNVPGVPINLLLPVLTSLGSSAFRGTPIEEVLDLGTIPTIGAYTFYACANLKKAVIPATCTTIGQQSFAVCKALETIICHNPTPPSAHAQTFMSTNNTFVIYVPDESVDAYKAATTWSGYASRIKPLSEYNG